MPRWVAHSKPLVGWRKRWRLNRDPSEILDAILPTAQVDKHWTDDRLNLFGLYSQAQGPGVATHLACMLTAQNKELLIHRVHCAITRGSFPGIEPVHIFTPLQGYNPVQNNTALFLPWLQTGLRTGEPGQLSEAFGTSGDNLALQVVNVNGAPHTCVGPLWYGPTALNVVGGWGERDVVIWSEQDPPLRIAPFTSVAVQTAQTITTSVLNFLDVSWYYSEREDQGRVG